MPCGISFVTMYLNLERLCHKFSAIKLIVKTTRLNSIENPIFGLDADLPWENSVPQKRDCLFVCIVVEFGWSRFGVFFVCLSFNHNFNFICSLKARLWYSCMLSLNYLLSLVFIFALPLGFFSSSFFLLRIWAVYKWLWSYSRIDYFTAVSSFMVLE